MGEYKKTNRYEIDGDVSYLYDLHDNKIIVDTNKLNELLKYCWRVRDDGYVVSSVHNGKPATLKMHRIVMNTPKGMDTDHINHNRADNRVENLRICTRSENAQNQSTHRDNKLGVKGVHVHTQSKINPYKAQIKVGGDVIYLGIFRTVDEASAAYKQAAKHYFGEYACGGNK